MNKIAEIIIIAIVNTAIILTIIAFVVSNFHEEAVKTGHAEYYINTNNFNKEWRWKIHKD